MNARGGNVESCPRGGYPLVVGLTGGIGSGKSRVAELFAALGAAIVDTDEISRALTAAGGEAMAALRAAFGANFMTADGALDAMLGKVADFYEQEVDEAVDSLSSLMEPMIMVVLGTLIGGIVVAMYLPIFKMGQAV